MQKQKEGDARALPKFPTAAQGSEGTDQRAKFTYSADLGTAQHLDFGNHSLPCYNIRADRTWQMKRLSHFGYFNNHVLSFLFLAFLINHCTMVRNAIDANTYSPRPQI